jgi:hypothetical protein
MRKMILVVQNVWGMVLIWMDVWMMIILMTVLNVVGLEQLLERIGMDRQSEVDRMYIVELAKLDDGSLIYGSVEEIEAHADQHDRFVTDYLDHLSPAHVQKFGKYVGKSLTDPYSVGGTHSRKMDYDLGRIVVTEKI